MAAAKESATEDGALTDPSANTYDAATTAPPAGSSNGRWRSLLARLGRDREDWLQINGYVAQEIRSDNPVLISAGSTLLGNVFAPKLQVEGIISGSAFADEIEIMAEGQVWGDVFTTALRVAPGGTIQGWVSTVNQDELLRLQQSDLVIDNAFISSHVEQLNEQAASDIVIRNDSEIAALHLLQAELATALAARVEMEQVFEKRLTAMAGEAYGKINALGEQLAETRGELTTQKRQLDTLQELTRQQKSQIERQTNELSVSRDLMSDQTRELTDLRRIYNELRVNFHNLEAEKAALDTALTAASTEKEQLDERINNLETAHRANLQYQIEQEESLIRWQELAETTERTSAESETKLQQAELQLEESRNTIVMLREQRQSLETELDKALSELQTLQANDKKPLVSAAALMAATEHITSLEKEARHKEQEYAEQLNWSKASLETSRSELIMARELLQSRDDSLAEQLEASNNARAEAHRQEVLNQELQAHLDTLVAEAAQEGTAAETWLDERATLQKSIARLQADNKNLQTVVRETDSRLDSTELELDRFVEETKAQGEHLAEVHARLVEREIQLQQSADQLVQARQMIEKQNVFIKQMKTVTTQKINALQNEISRLTG